MSRQGRLHGFSEGLLDPKHVQAIGDALWTFLWCIARQTPRTSNPDNEPGWVLRGQEIPVMRIVSRLGLSDSTARRHLRRLAKRQYIALIRGQRGFRIKLLKPLKFRETSQQSRPVTDDQSEQQNRASVENPVENPPDRSHTPGLRSVTDDALIGHPRPITTSYQINRSRDIPTSGASKTHATAGTGHRASGGNGKGRLQDRLYPYRDFMGNFHVASNQQAQEHANEPGPVIIDYPANSAADQESSEDA